MGYGQEVRVVTGWRWLGVGDWGSLGVGCGWGMVKGWLRDEVG